MILKMFIKKYVDIINSHDLGWVAILFGTALGAGILYLPASIAHVGFYGFLIITVILLPAVLIAHRNFVIFCLSSAKSSSDITDVIQEKFNPYISILLIFLYFMSIFPIALMYSIGMVNVINDVFIKDFHTTPPPRIISSMLLLMILYFIISKGEKWILIVSKWLVVILAITLLSLSIYLIQDWHFENLKINWSEFLTDSFLVVPLLVFVFNFAPACSAFAQSYRLRHKNPATFLQKTDGIIKMNMLCLSLIILPFIISCVLAMTSADVKHALDDNIPSIMAINHEQKSLWMGYMIQMITFLAIFSSFFGIYLGLLEGAKGIVFNFFVKSSKYNLHKRTNIVINLIILLICLIAGTLNWSVINLINSIVSPILAVLLFIMPIIVFYVDKRYKKHRNIIKDIFVLFIGIFIIVGYLKILCN